MTGDRAWLRSFLDLGARRREERIADAAIRLQEDTVLAALATLEREPGVLLADEVGMGKTYQALGVLAATYERARAEGRRPHLLVITPGADLNHQWSRAAGAFAQQGFYTGFPRDAFAEVHHITGLAEAVRRHPLVFAPVHVFTSARGHAERGFLLDLWFRRRALPGATRAAIRERVTRAGVQLAGAETFLGRGPESFERLPAEAFRNTRGGHAGLDDLHAAGGNDAFGNGRAVKKALDRVRFHAVRMLLPALDLLVVDEAHKLKNPWTVQSQAVAQVLGGRFARAVFLTATPFQLGVEELRRVFEMFARASGVRPGFAEDVEALFAAVTEYQRAYADFEERWRYATERQAEDVAAWYRATRGRPVDPDPRAPVPGLEGCDDPNVATLARAAWELRRLKDHGVQPGFRRWTLRSLKPGKRERRRQRAVVVTPDAHALPPLLLYQRLMVARARTGTRSHVEAAETNVASSFEAAREGAMVTGEAGSEEARAYQAVVQALLETTPAAHPKVARVIDEAMAAAERWEKSLLFCERNATIDAVHAEIEARWMARLHERWQGLYPGYTREQVFGAGSDEERARGVFQRWQQRFTKGDDQLSVALREAYPHTLLVPPDEDGLPDRLWQELGAILEDANDVLRGVRSGGTAAARLDYRVARRCVDVAVARWMERRRPAVLDGYGGVPRNLLHPDYPRLGIDLVVDEEERDLAGGADTPVQWRISPAVLDALLDPARPSIWFPFRAQLAGWTPTERGRLVEAVRTFLTRRQVPFLLDVLEHAGGAEATSDSFRSALELNWGAPDFTWRRRVAELLEYLPRLEESERAEVLGEALERGELAARGNRAERRQAIQDAFNTPFFPMILVGNRTMQEGLNLHRQCRRVVHHDLRWNPADLEQRVGRVDRHGSLAERTLAETAGGEGHIHVDTPLLERTIDPPRYRRVKEREKWLDFLLGAPLEVGRDRLDDAPVAPLPPELTEDLRVRLEPRTG